MEGQLGLKISNESVYQKIHKIFKIFKIVIHDSKALETKYPKSAHVYTIYIIGFIMNGFHYYCYNVLWLIFITVLIISYYYNYFQFKLLLSFIINKFLKWYRFRILPVDTLYTFNAGILRLK